MCFCLARVIVIGTRGYLKEMNRHIIIYSMYRVDALRLCW